MKKELARVKAADPKIDHKAAFTKAAANVSLSFIFVFRTFFSCLVLLFVHPGRIVVAYILL